MIDGTASPVITRRTALAGFAGMAAAAFRMTGAAGQQPTDRFTVIAAGIDASANHGDRNADVLMVARVDLRAGAVRVVSIPRDLYVPIPGHGQDKINRAFDLGYKAAGGAWARGAALLTETVEASFGIEVNGIATTTFEGFRDIVDIVGGVEVVNPYEVAGDAAHPVFPAGPQVLDGDAALAFVRTRSQDGDDGRVLRQQLVLAGLLRRLQEPGIVGDLPALLAASSGAVETDIPLGTQLRLLELVPGLGAEAVTFATITDYLWGGFLDSGMWVYQADWAVLPGVVQALLDGAA
jgi:LCP family protein required for cell wall assembly